MKLTLTSAALCKARHHFAPFSNLIFDGSVQVSKSSAESYEKLFEAFSAVSYTWTRRIMEDPFGDNLVYCVKVSFVEDLLSRIPNQGLVF
jgi:hypothetical protein